MIYSCFKSWVSLNCFASEELAATTLLPFLFQVRMTQPFHQKAIQKPSLFEVCSDSLKEVLHFYYRVPDHQAVIDIIIPQIAQMKSLVIEAVNNNDVDMCRRIALIYLQLGDDYIIPVIDESNSMKDDLLEVWFLNFFKIDVVDIVFVPFD